MFLTVLFGPVVQAGALDQRLVHLATRHVVHELSAMLQRHVAVAVVVLLLHSHTRWYWSPTWPPCHYVMLQSWNGWKGVRTLVLQEENELIWYAVAPSDSWLLERGEPKLLKALFSLSADVRAAADDVQLVLQEEARAVAVTPVDHGAEAAAAGFLGLADRVAQVHAHISSFYVHVTYTDAAAVKVAVLEEVHDGLREDEGDVEAVGLRDGGDGGRLDWVERSARGGGGCWRVQVRVLVFEGALDAGGASRCAWSAWRTWGGCRETRGGGWRQDTCATVTWRGTVGHEGCVGLRGVGLAVVLVHGAAYTGDVTEGRER